MKSLYQKILFTPDALTTYEPDLPETVLAVADQVGDECSESIGRSNGRSVNLV